MFPLTPGKHTVFTVLAICRGMVGLYFDAKCDGMHGLFLRRLDFDDVLEADELLVPLPS